MIFLPAGNFNYAKKCQLNVSKITLRYFYDKLFIACGFDNQLEG